ncbi:MAG: hypothetical protein COU47_00240 [Candidatus Niyogibacteria bacterium CG10_big_fil_rev_8_21_14_0_10_46_36]|uniref:Uncharacterized protein n=1 Tax=Candidatus Niyogibacteria bacterium CG10_big_fil_rev_8_21_14_0_10_46_36 TaxID=1974726 RepID=A0A2H0TGC6_9BACT|nr:MAG: hypothetical protein COU47_00240 [Candidatus Niyogibacteria bacterium CG10_big_fil_rev_8_21_14_0_10_46_36]
MTFINESGQNNENPADLSGVPPVSGGSTDTTKKGPDQLFYTKPKGAAGWLLQYSGGLIKNEMQANYAMIGFAVIALAISFFVVFSGRQKQELFTPGAEAPPAEVIAPANF